MSSESRIWEIRPFGSMRGGSELVIGLGPFIPTAPAYSTKEDMECLNTAIMYSVGKHPPDRETFFKAIEGFTDEQLLRNEDVTHNTILALKLFGEKKRAQHLQKLKVDQERGKKA